MEKFTVLKLDEAQPGTWCEVAELEPTEDWWGARQALAGWLEGQPATAAGTYLVFKAGFSAAKRFEVTPRVEFDVKELDTAEQSAQAA